MTAAGTVPHFLHGAVLWFHYPLLFHDKEWDVMDTLILMCQLLFLKKKLLPVHVSKKIIDVWFLPFFGHYSRCFFMSST